MRYIELTACNTEKKIAVAVGNIRFGDLEGVGLPAGCCLEDADRPDLYVKETYAEVKALIDKAIADQRLEDFTKAALSALDGYHSLRELVAEDAVKIAQLTIEHLEQP